MVHLDHLHYPHLVDNILSFITSGSDIAAFRLTSHHFRDRIDSVLARHFVLRAEDGLMWIATRRWGSFSPGLHLDLRLLHCLDTEVNRVPLTVVIPPTTYYRSAKILDVDSEDHCPASLCTNFPNLEVLRSFHAAGKLPAAPTTVIFWSIGDTNGHEMSLGDVRRLVIRPYSPSDSMGDPYDALPVISWTGHGIIEDLVLIGKIVDVAQYAAEIVGMIQDADEVKRIILIGCGIDLEEMLHAVEPGAESRIELLYNELPLDWRILLNVEWLSMTVDEYKNTLTEDEVFLFLDDTEFVDNHKCAATTRATGKANFWWMYEDEEAVEEPQGCSVCFGNRRMERLTAKQRIIMHNVL